jgi:hypothetical protein
MNAAVPSIAPAQFDVPSVRRVADDAPAGAGARPAAERGAAGRAAPYVRRGRRGFARASRKQRAAHGGGDR